MLAVWAGIHNMLVRIANREDPDRTVFFSEASDMGLHCLTRPFWRATSVGNFTTSTVINLLCDCIWHLNI